MVASVRALLFVILAGEGVDCIYNEAARAD